MKMGKIKIRFILVAVVAIMLSFVNQSTLAYYQTVGRATNVITSGDFEYIVRERTDWGMDFPSEGVYVHPGDVVSKEVTIENNCSHPFYVRVKLVYGVNSEELSSEDCFKVNINSEYWEEHDGWFYYKDVVEPGVTTPYVFSHVEIVGSKVDNRYIGKTLSLTVKSQIVQSRNNTLENGKTYTASGWPSEV